MRIRAFVLTLLFVLSSAYPTYTKSNMLNSIRPIQTTYTDKETSKTGVDTFCTAWATMYRGEHVWVTAAHCMDFDEDNNPSAKGYTIDGKPVKLLTLEFTPHADVAVLSGGPKAEPFAVAYSSPSPLQPIWSGGYPHDSTSLHVVTGVFSNEHDSNYFSEYNLPVARGMSGGPVVSQDGLVIGVMRTSECSPIVGWCAVSGGTPTSDLRRVLRLD